MALHLVKMCVGCESIAALRTWQEERRARGLPTFHRTRNQPRRAAEILAGGSLYWIIKGQVRVRQRVLAITPAVEADGRTVCHLELDDALVETEWLAHRPMQGWRYMAEDEAPRDRRTGIDPSSDEADPTLARELAELGLL